MAVVVHVVLLALAGRQSVVVMAFSVQQRMMSRRTMRTMRPCCYQRVMGWSEMWSSLEIHVPVSVLSIAAPLAALLPLMAYQWRTL